MAGPEDAGGNALQVKKPGLMKRLPAAIYECAEFAYSARGYVRLANLAASEAPDILYERYNLHYFAGAWLARRAGLPFILEVNGPLAEDFLEPADPGRIRDRYGLQGKLVLGFSGFVREWHGVDRAVRYLARANRNDLHLLIVGDGPARGGLEALANELGVAQQVTVTGVVQRDVMPQYVAAFDIALQPAVTAYASPLKLFEYMALGKPVLAPDAANIMEVLHDGENGLMFRGEGFDVALDALVADEALRQRLGAAARETIERDDYTWAANARRVEEVMERLKVERK
jgi:glycosyltransferase involved in cell wall biosynthesis